MIRKHWLFLAAIALTVAAAFFHYSVSDAAGTFAASLPLLLVAPLVAHGTDALQGRLPTSIVGIVQSGFGNVAELAIVLFALADNRPDLALLAIVGSILGNAILLGGITGLMPTIRARGRSLVGLTFDRQLFTGITTLSVISFVPFALLNVPSRTLDTGGQQELTLIAGIVLLIVGVLFIIAEIRRPHAAEGEIDIEHRLSIRWAVAYLATGGLIAALTSEWFVAGFQPAIEKAGIPTQFAALIIVPLIGNVAENFVALRYAWQDQGNAAMSVIMHSVVQIALLMTGIVVVASQFIGSTALTLDLQNPLLTVAMGLSLFVLWMVVHDGEIEPIEAVGLLGTYAILGALLWVQ